MILPSGLWVAALMKRASQAGAFLVVVRRGDERAGAVMVKVANRRSGETRLYSEALRADGESVWIQPRPTADEGEIDAYLERAARIDPDVWVIEIEDRESRHFLTEPVE